MQSQQLESVSADGNTALSADRAQSLLRTQGYSHIPGAVMRALCAACAPLDDWPAFADSWTQLAIDAWMADRAAYRRRRHAVVALHADGTWERQPHQPHWQSLDYNRLHGGVERWFEAVAAADFDSSSLRAVLTLCARLFQPLRPEVARWRVEIHQFRIEARAGQPGLPTPEGVHRDGVDWVLVLMIGRHNIRAGTTTIHDLDGQQIGSFTLTDPFDAALVDDHRCFHGVTPVLPADPAATGWRDVLVVTLRAEG